MGGIFHFYSNLNRTFCKQTEQNRLSGLELYYLPMSHKKDARLIGVKEIVLLLMIIQSAFKANNKSMLVSFSISFHTKLSLKNQFSYITKF